MATADRRRRTQIRTALLSAVLAVTLGACASSAPTAPSATGSSAAAPSSSPASSSPASSSPASSSPAVSSSKSKTGAPGTTTLTGTVTEGVESGCILLTDDAGAVLANLLGMDRMVAPIGSLIEVTGEFETDMMTTCQQGKPFSVSTVQVRQ